MARASVTGDEEFEAWNIELANELIGKTKKLEGVEIVTREVYKVNIKTLLSYCTVLSSG